jgi:hypothetical protein
VNPYAVRMIVTLVYVVSIAIHTCITQIYYDEGGLTKRAAIAQHLIALCTVPGIIMMWAL